MVLSFVFIILALSSMICLFAAINARRRNWGVLIYISIAIIANVICIFLLDCKNVVAARKLLSFYYICQALLFISTAYIAVSLTRYKRLYYASILIYLTTLLQVIIVIYNFVHPAGMMIARHLFIGQAWWVAENGRNSFNLMSLFGYNMLATANSFLLFIIISICCIRSPKLYRKRVYILLIMHTTFFVISYFSARYSIPVWILCCVQNLFCYLFLYFINVYADRKLQEWSLFSFANEMSEGFVLYNEFDDPIYINDQLKEILSEDLIDSFRKKEELDAWLNDTVLVGDAEFILYNTESGAVYFNIDVSNLTQDNVKLGTGYIFRNVTNSVLKIQEMQDANTELEQAAKMKSDFLANMSHEIRTPMNAVIGMAEIALREDLADNVRDYLLQIQNSGRNLLNIINDILDFSKIEAGKMEIFPDRYEPLSEINDIANVLVTRIGDKELELFVIADSNIPHALEGDAMRIRQIIINLANNAIKFTQRGTVIINISCENISDDEVMLTYHIIDTGQGISEKDLEKIFVSFQQVDSKRNRSVEGTGLGLAISQRLCKAMGGSIGVKSEYGKGSDFYFNIPQKVVDSSLELVVENAEDKHAFVINENPAMINEFINEMDRLGVGATVLHSIFEYSPTGKRDYIFFDERDYDDDIHDIISRFEASVGVCLVKYDSMFETDVKNIRIMRRPQSTLSMIMTLNGKEMRHSGDVASSFKVDYKAPDAKILIVDDNAINITIAEGLLQPIGAQCYAAENGMEAIEKLKVHEYDIVLMDHMMPELDGVDTTKIIRETIPQAANIPIVALTANAMEGVKEMFIEAGMNDFIAKPIDVRELVTKLRQWLPEDKIVKLDDVIDLEPEDDDEIVEYDGLDSKRAIKSLGSKELFEKIVKEYYKSGATKRKDIVEDYNNRSWDDYTIKVHALKSSSRQIGAYDVGDLAEEMEVAGKAGDIVTIKKKTDSLLNAYDALLEKLSKYFETEEVSEVDLQEFDKTAFDNIIERLTSAFDDLDMDEMEACKEEFSKYSYSDEVKAKLSELYEAIDNIDIDTGLDLIKQLKTLV
ncbi:MAG: response regulator [Lachnospiraceae bacterium]|nr:response regulator [Lachnospiraceae bacterium]